MKADKILILTTIVPSYGDTNYSTLIKTLNILIKEKINIHFIYFGNDIFEDEYDSFVLSRMNVLRADLNKYKENFKYKYTNKMLEDLNKYIEKEAINKIYTLFNIDEIENIFTNFYENCEKEVFIHALDEITPLKHKNYYLYKENGDLKLFEKHFYKFIAKEQTKDQKLKILEVNNVDILGRRFNGFDILDKINTDTKHSAYQIVTDKLSTNKNVYNFFLSDEVRWIESQIQKFEREQLSVHSNLSAVGNYLENNDVFKHTDLVHYHLIHNTKLPLNMLSSLFSKKPTIVSIHDPWNFTGRCVQPEECLLWKNGCIKCPNLSSEFPMKYDNCRYLWKLKKKIYKNMDIDIVVSTPYMKQMLSTCELTSHFKNVHVIPFGIDLKMFNEKLSKEEAREKLNISKNDLVLFHRAQEAFKGTKYFKDALKELKTNKKVTIITCSTLGLLKELENQYNIIDLGTIDTEQLLTAYTACDIFVMPSIGESFGMMAIEAMACGKPIIIFDNTALPYVTFAPDCGYLVKNKDSRDLMKALKYLIENDEERARRGNLSRKLAETHYDLEKYNSKMIELYEKVYTRQINKKLYDDKNIQIDYNNPDSLRLIKFINRYSKKMFFAEIPMFDFKENKDNIITNNTKIDYSLDSVQGVIKEFNKKVYEKFLYYEDKFKFSPKTLNDYFINKERYNLLSRIKRIISQILRKFGLNRSNTILLFKRNKILRAKMDNFESQISELNEKIYEHSLNIISLEDEIENLSKIVERQGGNDDE